MGMSVSTVSPSLGLAAEEWEDLCRDAGGWEYIDGSIPMPKAGVKNATASRNEFGEKIGLARLKEALEANDWEGRVGLEGGVSGEGLGSEDDMVRGDDLGDIEKIDLEGNPGALEESLLERGANEEEASRSEVEVQGDGCDEDVQALEGAMLRLQAVRDMAADMPDAERKRLAAKVVGEVAKGL